VFTSFLSISFGEGCEGLAEREVGFEERLVAGRVVHGCLPGCVVVTEQTAQ